MREIIALILFFGLVGLVHVLFINSLWNAARRGPPEPPVRKAGGNRGGTMQPASLRCLPRLLLRLLPFS